MNGYADSMHRAKHRLTHEEPTMSKLLCPLATSLIALCAMAHSVPSWAAEAQLKAPVVEAPSGEQMGRLLPSAHCFCQLSCGDNTNHTGGAVNSFIMDLGQLATYTGPFAQSDSNQTACNTLCTNKAMTLSQQDVANAACAHGCPSGSLVRAWSKVGTREWKSSQGFGVLTNSPSVSTTTCTCPADWAANSTNQYGGVTTDGKCKKDLNCAFGNVPPPANATPIGSWGFTWGPGIVAWGTPQNGGAPTCVTRTTPGMCKLN